MNPLPKKLLHGMLGSKRLNKLAVRLYSHVRPPPYRRANMEFDFDVWNGISTLLSVDGRPIGENNANPVVYKELVETEHKVCAFAGSRHGLPINVTALRHVMSVWDDTLQLLTLLRNDFLRRRGIDGPRLNLRQGYVFSKLAAAFPAYQARRRQDPIDALASLENAYFTVGVGPFMVVRSLMERGDPMGLHDAPLSGAEIYQIADDAGTLISGRGYACAGSKKLIIDLLDVAMNGSYQKPLDSASARKAIDRIGDWDRFYAYVIASSRLELLIKSAEYLCAQQLWALRSDLSESERALANKCLSHADQLPAGEDDDRLVTGHFIAIALALLDELGASEVRAALTQAGLLQPPRERHRPDARAWAAHQVRLIMEILYPFCRQELERTHGALQRFESTSITLDDLYSRCCGPDVVALLSSLEASSARQRAAAEIPA